MEARTSRKHIHLYIKIFILKSLKSIYDVESRGCGINKKVYNKPLYSIPANFSVYLFYVLFTKIFIALCAFL